MALNHAGNCRVGLDLHHFYIFQIARSFEEWIAFGFWHLREAVFLSLGQRKVGQCLDGEGDYRFLHSLVKYLILFMPRRLGFIRRLALGVLIIAYAAVHIRDEASCAKEKSRPGSRTLLAGTKLLQS